MRFLRVMTLLLFGGIALAQQNTADSQTSKQSSGGMKGWVAVTGQNGQKGSETTEIQFGPTLSQSVAVFHDAQLLDSAENGSVISYISYKLKSLDADTFVLSGKTDDGKESNLVFRIDDKSQLCLNERRVYRLSAFEPFVGKDVTVQANHPLNRNAKGEVYAIRLDNGPLEMTMGDISTGPKPRKKACVEAALPALPTGEVSGIPVTYLAGGAVVVLAIGVTIVFVARRRRRKPDQSPG